MWLALIMAFNVWFVIWPNQQKVLGLVEASADAKAAAGRLAGMTSRINTHALDPDAVLHGGAAERRSLIAAGLPVPPWVPASRRPSFRPSGRVGFGLGWVSGHPANVNHDRIWPELCHISHCDRAGTGPKFFGNQ